MSAILILLGPVPGMRSVRRCPPLGTGLRTLILIAVPAALKPKARRASRGRICFDASCMRRAHSTSRASKAPRPFRAAAGPGLCGAALSRPAARARAGVFCPGRPQYCRAVSPTTNRTMIGIWCRIQGPSAFDPRSGSIHFGAYRYRRFIVDLSLLFLASRSMKCRRYIDHISTIY